MVVLLLVRGLFSGWDLTYDLSIPKAVKWSLDLAIYAVPGAIALRRIRSRFMLPATILVLAYLAASLLSGLLHPNSIFGIEKSITLTFINAIEIVSMAATCAALIRGDLVIPDRLLDWLAGFGLAYIAVSVAVAGYLAMVVVQGGEPTLVSERFFFINPLTQQMSATFSEPSYLGFYVGFCALLYRSRFPTRTAIGFIIFSGGALYLLVGAKFAMIAYPLSLLMAPLVHRMTQGSVRMVMYAVFIGLFVSTSLGLDVYVYRNWLGNIDYDSQQTFVTRFAYLFSSLRHMVWYPLGTGFGGYMFTLPNDMWATVEMTRGLANYELIDELATGFNFGPKDSTSMTLLLAGWLGVIGFVEGFLLLLRICRRRRTICSTMVIYVLLSIAVYVNAVAVPIFFAVIVMMIADLRSVRQVDVHRLSARV